MTTSDGSYSLGALTDSRLSFAREGWEPLEIEATPSGHDDVPMHHVMRAVSGARPIEGRLAPNDLDYSLAAGGPCSPCRLVRITSAPPGTVTVRLAWTTSGVVLTLHANGQTYVGDAASRELSIDLAAGADDVLIYVGSPHPLAATQHVPFTVAVTPSGPS
jgi:hypothetical protein